MIHRHPWMPAAGLALVGFAGALPALDAGPERRLRLPETRFVLTGSATGAWTQIAGPERARVQDPVAKDLLGIVGTPGTYVFRLRVGGVSATTQVVVEANPWVPATASVAADHVLYGARPQFRDGHGMMPLSDMFQTGERLAVALADHFGFGLTVTLSPGEAGGTIDLTTGDHTAQMLRAAIASGGRHRLVLTYGNVLPGGNVDENRFLATAPAQAWLRRPDGSLVIHGDGAPLMSPAAPDAWIRSLATALGHTARAVTDIYPASLALSGGEYGLAGYDSVGQYAADDPAVRAAIGGNPANNDVYRYTARRRAEMEAIVQDEILGRNTTFAGPRMQGLYSDSYSAERGRFNGWLSYNYPFEETQAVTPAVSTVSMPEIYWNHVTNSGFTGMYSYQIDGLPLPKDIATHVLNDIGGGLETTGMGLFYGWLSAGWNDTGVADRERWMGFTKMLCTLGMVGGITGYFTVDDAFIAGHIRDGAVGATPPSWLWQMTDLSHAIALFSHVEDFVRGGTLVAGSRRHPYRASGYFTDYDGGLATKRLYALDLPASETTAEGEPRSFVVARRHADGGRWILTAWCMQGPERDLTAQLPGVGPVVLRGRPAGSVYLLDRRGAEPVLRLLDRDAMRPTADLFPRGDLLAGGEIPADGAANTAPVITVPAAADPAVVLGATTALRAGAEDDGGAGTLRWSWRAASGTPAPVFARTGTAEAATTTVRFLAAGSYLLEATVRDAGGLTATTAVPVTVVPVPTGIRIEPAAVTVAAGGMVDLRGTVVDQFDTTLADPPPMAWSMADGPGTIDSRGRYTAPPAGTATATIQVVAGSLRRTVPVTVTVTGAPGGGGGGGGGGGCGAGALLAALLVGGFWLRQR